MKRIAVAGATGAVGVEILKVLEQRNFPVENLTLLASSRSAGTTIEFKGQTLTVKELTDDSFEAIDIALFSAGGSITKKFAPAAVQAGAVVIDNSSAYRMDPEVPLIIPEINPEDIKNHKGIIANPNCSTIIMLMAIYPLHKLYNVKRIVVSTYQAASGAGYAAMEELRTQAGDYLANKELKTEVLPHPIAFNVFSHNSDIDSQTGYNAEEIKMVKETHKILHDDSIKVTPTCIRVSTFRAHAESIHIETEKPVDLDVARKALSEFPGVRVVDDIERNYFPMPVESSGLDDVLVGRLRYDIGSKSKNDVELFCCGDQLLKGAALNAVQIAELLEK